MKSRICLLSLLYLINPTGSFAYHCDRTPERTTKPPNTVEGDKYFIDILGDPQTYVPGINYTIILRASSNSGKTRARFTQFTLVVEPQDNPENFQSTSTGNFNLFDNMMTKFSTKCRNTVIQTNTLAKSEVFVSWIAPPTKSGCVVFKATVVESLDNWFSDTNGLTKILCEEDSESEERQPLIVKNCCACEEAKYEVAFQGLWSRNTHYKHFPTDVWTTKFSDIVGASHRPFKPFWDYGGMASEGLKALAEEGNTIALETELKEMVKNEDIRTIIKARELSYPNVTGTSYTVFRVDSEHHVISLVSKITPSPDWIVGVANFELCLKNCSWVESRTLNLYPWDIGTDDGLSYESMNMPTTPPQVIRRIKPDNPNSEESPFYNTDGEPIKPLAKLHLTRQKLYEKKCTSSETLPESEDLDDNCATTAWSPWSSCNRDCITIQQRSYLNPEAHEYCQVKRVNRRRCIEENGSCQEENQNLETPELSDSKCQLSEWSDWSSCSATCGRGVRTRDRTYLNSYDETQCDASTQENEECVVTEEACEDEETPQDCSNIIWGNWTQCSSTCGNGIKKRYRVTDVGAQDTETTDSCKDIEQVVTCYNQPCDSEGEDGTTPESVSRIDSENLVIGQGPDGPVINCKVSEWSEWSPCNATAPCKKGYKYRVRHILREPSNGGKRCPSKLRRAHRCWAPCNNGNSGEATWGSGQRNEDVVIDCKMGEWSAWSPCSAICGPSSVQLRTRSIVVYPSRNGKKCGSRTETRKCHLPLTCNQDGSFPY